MNTLSGHAGRPACHLALAAHPFRKRCAVYGYLRCLLPDRTDSLGGSTAM
jgi:hypothetical protein